MKKLKINFINSPTLRSVRENKSFNRSSSLSKTIFQFKNIFLRVLTQLIFEIRVDKMKLIFALIFIVLIALCNGSSQPVIKNTKESGCFDGQCGDHCSYDGAKLFPNDNLNQPGKCRFLKCEKNFDVLITNCPHDRELRIQITLLLSSIYLIFLLASGKYEYVNRDSKKLYPECCGTKVLKKPAGK